LSKLIKLYGKQGEGKFAIVDNEDFEYINKIRWNCNVFGYAVKVQRKEENYNQREVLSIHRLIMKAKKGDLIDHINGNKLDNRKENLRFADKSKNAMNMHSVYGAIPYKGVYFDKSRNNFCTRISIDGKQKIVGRYNTAEEAAKAYDEAAIKYYGEFANINFK
jgi:hypothetical protein